MSTEIWADLPDDGTDWTLILRTINAVVKHLPDVWRLASAWQRTRRNRRGRGRRRA